ncbi:MAG: hypothetical protein JWL85_754 [Candidatus Saccharibacteria bacterium]|nr:hypothetical protein [Candidatus Saccharibacteria bacterium]
MSNTDSVESSDPHRGERSGAKPALLTGIAGFLVGALVVTPFAWRKGAGIREANLRARDKAVLEKVDSLRDERRVIAGRFASCRIVDVGPVPKSEKLTKAQLLEKYGISMARVILQTTPDPKAEELINYYGKQARPEVVVYPSNAILTMGANQSKGGYAMAIAAKNQKDRYTADFSGVNDESAGTAHHILLETSSRSVGMIGDISFAKGVTARNDCGSIVRTATDWTIVPPERTEPVLAPEQEWIPAGK